MFPFVESTLPKDVAISASRQTSDRPQPQNPMRTKNTSEHLGQVNDCRRTVIYYEQMIKIGELNEREGWFFSITTKTATTR